MKMISRGGENQHMCQPKEITSKTSAEYRYEHQQINDMNISSGVGTDHNQK